jgi:phytoene/squalene synthetase
MMLLDPRRSRSSDPADQYDALASSTARLVIRRYSTSFGLAARLLDEPVRCHVRHVYALVRVADEIVDAPRAGESDDVRRALLDDLEAETLTAMRTGHSANLVVHAFARTAQECGIEPALVTPFFASMRTDLDVLEHDQESLDAYVHGSAEVVGLMCLRAFLRACPDPDAAYAELAPGACRLGAAFQKLNFLRDLAADHRELGRRYFPGVDPDALTVAQRDALLDDIDADLGVAAAAVERLPESSRRAVRVALVLFAELGRRLRATAPERICTERVRVPNPVKTRLVAREVLRGRP